MELRLSVADESDLQVWSSDDRVEYVLGQFWATAPVLDDTAEYYVGSFSGISGHTAPFYLYVDVVERSRLYGDGIGDYMEVRFVPDEAEVPSP